jgi:hypothetical protein
MKLRKQLKDLRRVRRAAQAARLSLDNLRDIIEASDTPDDCVVGDHLMDLTNDVDALVNAINKWEGPLDDANVVSSGGKRLGENLSPAGRLTLIEALNEECRDAQDERDEAQRIAAERLDVCPYWQSDPACRCVVCRLRNCEAERDRLRAAIEALFEYQRTGGPEYPDWDRYFDRLEAALKG